VAGVTVGSRNTCYRAARYGLTRTGLAPVGLRQLLLAPSEIQAREMTKSLFDDPTYWRAHAAQIRAQAEQMGDPDAKRMMLEIAANYDALTKRAEQRNKLAQ